MIDRTRLAVSGAVLAVFAFSTNALLAWISYQRDLDQVDGLGGQWMPNYWEYLRSGLGLTMHFLFAFSVVMMAVAFSMRTKDDDALFRPDL